MTKQALVEWIPVKDRLPDSDGQAVLVYGEVWIDTFVVDSFLSHDEPSEDCVPFFETGFYFTKINGDADWGLAVNEQDAISHWMPLPPAPTINGAK